jgi:uncharacterized membrane protein YkoI
MEFAMLSKMTLSAALMAAALAGAPAAYAATGTNMTGSSPGSSAVTALAPTSTGNSVGQDAAMRSPAQATTARSVRFVSLYERVSPKDVAAFGSSKVSLDEAIADAQRSTSGTAVEAVFKAAPGKPHYLVWLTKDNRLFRSTVDAQSGAVAGAAHGLPLHRLYPSQRADVKAVEQAKASLADAVAIAAKDSNDKPIAASLLRSEGMRSYHVAVIENGAVQTIWVSPDNPMTVASK